MRSLISSLLVSIAFLVGAEVVLAAGPDIEWTQSYGGAYEDVGYSLAKTPGGYMIAGWTYSYGEGDADVFLVRTDASGNRLWSKTLGGSGDDVAYCIEKTTNGSFIVAGQTSSFGNGNYDVYLLKVSASGDSVWQRTYGGAANDGAWSVKPTSDSGYVLAGYTASFGAGRSDVYVIKTDGEGRALWSRTYGGAGYERGNCIIETHDGYFVVVGYTTSFGAGTEDVYLLKINSDNGDTVWTRTFGGLYPDEGYSVIEASDGSYVVCGCTWSSGAGLYDVYLIATDPDGNPIWTKTYGGRNHECGAAVREALGGGYIVAGWTYSYGAGSADVYLLRTYANGDTMWTKTCGEAEFDCGYSILETAEEEYVMVGETSSGNQADVYLIKTGTDPAGVDHQGLHNADPIRLSCSPNPLVESSLIEFDLPRATEVSVTVYNPLGGEVRALLASTLGSGTHALVWDGMDNDNRMVPSGTYFLKLKAGGEVQNRKIVVLR